MNCEHIRELLGNYIDEELTESMRLQLDWHFETCSACRLDRDTLAETVKGLHSQAGERPSHWFAERLLDRLARATDAGTMDSPVGSRKQLPLWSE